MWRRIRVVVASIIAIVFVTVVTAQAVHAWRTTKEGAVGGATDNTEATPPPCDATACKPGDLSCQIQQQTETISRLQATINNLSKIANEALTKANAAAESAQKVGKAALSAHNARDAEASAAAAPLAGVGAKPLPATPIPQSSMVPASGSSSADTAGSVKSS
jgi:hypothetical protein